MTRCAGDAEGSVSVSKMGLQGNVYKNGEDAVKRWRGGCSRACVLPGGACEAVCPHQAACAMVPCPQLPEGSYLTYMEGEGMDRDSLLLQAQQAKLWQVGGAEACAVCRAVDAQAQAAHGHAPCCLVDHWGGRGAGRDSTCAACLPGALLCRTPQPWLVCQCPP